MEDLILIDIKATGFLYGMVRSIVGQLVLVGEKKISPDIFKDRFLVVNLVKENEYLNVRYQEKPFMLWIWISAILISLGGITNIFKKNEKQIL